MKQIEISDICKKYGEKVILSHFTLNIEYGEKIAIMGPSGSGKTTLLRIISHLETQDSGSINGLTQKISFVFQENRLCEDFSPVSNIRFVTGKAVPNEKIIKTLNDFGLNSGLDKPVKNMSGGMKRRVAIIRALLADCELLLMDEPFKGLDDKLKITVMEKIKEHIKDKTVILVTHNSDEATFLCDRIVNL